MSEEHKQISIDSISARSGMKVTPFEEDELERIHQATLELLEKTGMKFPSERALKLFADGGAEVDFQNQIVKIPSNLLMKCIAKAPRTFNMASRGSKNLDLSLDGTKTYFGTVGTGTTTVDVMEEVRRSRASTKEDVAMMALICDYLPSVSFYWPSVCAQDVDPEVLALHELEAAIINTEKHTHIINCTDGKTAAYAVEMAKVISGGSEVMRKRPPFSLYMATFSPLSQNEGLIDAALVFSEAGLPLVIGTTPIAGLSAPGSLMGAMLLGNAEILSMVCLTQLVNPGAPVCYAFFYAVMNPITAGEWATGPQKSAFQAGVNQLGHYYNLPVMCCSGSNDDNEPGGWLAGKEYTVDAFSAALTGAELVSSMGLLENYTLLYPEKIIFDNEIFYSVKALSEGIQTDFDTASVAIKEIIEVGHEGHFLDRDYTRENIRKLWQQGIANQWSSQTGGFRDPRETAIEKVKWILENHKPKRLDEKIRNEISNIIASAERELVK